MTCLNATALGLPNAAVYCAQMFIYVSGPYSADPAVPPDEQTDAIQANVDRAVDTAISLAALGHVPFVPHSMFTGWDHRPGCDRALIMAMCEAWLSRCDALFVIADSPGARVEYRVAEAMSLPIYASMSEVPRTPR